MALSSIVFYLVLIAPSASAHVPHDPVSGVSAPPGGDWFVVLTLESSSELFVSRDQGDSWSMAGGEPMADPLLGAIGLNDGTTFVFASERAWRWNGEWTEVPLPAPMTAAAGGEEPAFGGPNGLWVGDPLTQLLSVPIAYVGAGVAVDDSGTVYVEGGKIADAPAAMTAAARSESAVYAGNEEGQLWRWDGAWSACGALPEHEEPNDIVRIEADSETLLVGTGSRAPFSSADGCHTFVDVHAPLDTDYGNAGDAGSVSQAVAAMILGERWIVGGWEGLASSDDGGETWSAANLVPPDYTRALLFGPDDRLFVGSYTAGVLVTNDGGESFDGLNASLADANIQRLSKGSALWAVAGHNLWRSDDKGERWTAPTAPFDTVIDVFADDETWAMGAADGELGALVKASDDGTSWQEADPLSGSLPRGMARVNTSLCIAGVAPVRVLCSADGPSPADRVWEQLYEADADEVAGPVEAGGEALWADMFGVHSATIDTNPTGNDEIRVLAVGDDGIVWAATRSGALWSSNDDGAEWLDTGGRLPGTVYALAPAPSTPGTVLVGTHDGAYLVQVEANDTASISRFSGYERVDDRSPFVDCDACDGLYGRDDAALSTMQPLTDGATLRVPIRGNSLRVVGDPAGSLELRVDGEDFPSGGCGSELAAVEGLADGWHDVELTGSGAMVDYVEGQGEGELLPPAQCAAARGRGTFSWLFAAFWIAGRRRMARTVPSL